MKVGKQPSRLVSFFSLLGIILSITVLDIKTGKQADIFPLYYIPISLAGRWLTQRYTMAIAAFCLPSWILSKYLNGTRYSQASYWILNIIMHGISFFFVAFIVTKMWKYYEQERNYARMDKLTNLLNLRGFKDDGQQLIALCQRGRHPLVIAYIDLDNFKNVNDTQGHQRGDDMLRCAGQIMKNIFRTTDIIGRLGGDEFAVILPESSIDDALLPLERLRCSIQERMALEGCNITASIGAVAFRWPQGGIDALTRAADQVMYEVKKTGKNQVKIVVGSEIVSPSKEN